MSATDNLRCLQIRANLMADRELCLLDVDVDVRSGIVYLSGEVESTDQKVLAEELAGAAVGLDGIENNIRVVPDSMIPWLKCSLDEGSLVCGEVPYTNTAGDLEKELKSKLKEAFERVDVSVSGCCIACVDGSVSSEEELLQLQYMVLRTHGVVGIDSNISIKSL